MRGSKTPGIKRKSREGLGRFERDHVLKKKRSCGSSERLPHFGSKEPFSTSSKKVMSPFVVQFALEVFHIINDSYQRQIHASA
ncbi:putative hemicentin-1 [Sesbania bispinosa]|nr:putative hemicentin-1 [Sesbania bispinosa]